MYTNIGSIEYTDVFSVKSLTRQLIHLFRCKIYFQQYGNPKVLNAAEVLQWKLPSTLLMPCFLLAM